MELTIVGDVNLHPHLLRNRLQLLGGGDSRLLPGQRADLALPPEHGRPAPLTVPPRGRPGREGVHRVHPPRAPLVGVGAVERGLAGRREAGVAEERADEAPPGAVAVVYVAFPAAELLAVVLLDLGAHALGEDGALGVDDAGAHAADAGGLVLGVVFVGLVGDDPSGLGSYVSLLGRESQGCDKRQNKNSQNNGSHDLPRIMVTSTIFWSISSAVFPPSTLSHAELRRMMPKFPQ